MERNNRTKLIIKIAAGALLLAAMVYATVRLWPVISSGEIVEIIRGCGAWGVAAFLGLQLLQILAAFLPGEPVEVAAGVLYGAWWGLALCLIGVAAGTVLIYYAVRLFGAKSLENDPRFDKLRFLKDPDKAYRLIFILFLIPGTPKDILSYFGPFIPIKPMRFFTAAVLGRIPSIVTSTLAGAALYDGNIKMTIVYFVIAAVLAATGIYINKKIEEKMNHDGNDDTDDRGQTNNGI